MPESISSAEPSRGRRDSLIDVAGVSVGHATLAAGNVQTGVTALLPHPGNLFQEKVPAACHVINGFGKTTGLLQIRELGSIETPILLTNTLSVGTAYDSLVRYMLRDNPTIGQGAGTVNPLIAECNDGYLNDIRGLHVTEATVNEALKAAKKSAGGDFSRGAVGAGRGMSCYELKGGIGTASRTVSLTGETFTIGSLVLTNFGKVGDLVIKGQPVGKALASSVEESGPDKGSVIVILATDAPLSSRQLGRLARRASTGLARTGAVVASGSGEIAIAFSTRNRIPHENPGKPVRREALHEENMDTLFRAATAAVEGAVLDSLFSAETTTGRSGHLRYGLRELAERQKLVLPERP